MDPNKILNDFIKGNKVVIFSKTTCPYCDKVKRLFDSLNEPYACLEFDKEPVDRAQELRIALTNMTGVSTVPNVFVNGIFVGGCDNTFTAHSNGSLADLLSGVRYDYDLIVIGGGSGGLAASKEAARLGKRVAVCDFVTKTPRGTDWGLGGTCVNVGCIPKKLMHQAALTGDVIKRSQYFGWGSPEVTHDWGRMISEVNSYIKSLNFGYRKALRDKGVTYLNSYAEFVDLHTIKVTDKKGNAKTITSKDFIIACGGRPNYPTAAGSMECGITSDDLFWKRERPGKTLIVGASYIALECAGFLHGLGVDVTVMVRSILLRGFDQQIAEMIGDHMKDEGLKILRPCIPVKFEKVKDAPVETYKATAKMLDSDEEIEDTYNMILFAVGRHAVTKDLHLERIGVNINQYNGKIIVNEAERTNVNNVYAIGDVIDGKLELTPVAIQAGVLLARRLYGNETKLMDYVNVPTTVFTPLEYGCVGYSEEEAIQLFGQDDIEVYHAHFNPLEFELSKHLNNKCYAKLVCRKSDEEKVIGFHVFGPNAGEITQGYAIGLKLGAKKSDFFNLIGIHPTCAEIFTTMSVTKSSGASIDTTGC